MKLLVSLLIVLLSSSVAFGQNTLGTARKIVFATYQYGDNTREQNIQPAAQLFSEVADIEVQVISYPTVTTLLDAMKKGEVDVVFINTAGYLLAREASYTFEPVVQLNLPAKYEDEYKTVFVIGKNLEMNTLEQVLQASADFVLVLVSPTSTSGNLVPRLKLSSLQSGIPERFFLEIQYAKTHANALTQALNGEFSLCALGSGTYYQLGADTTRLKKLWESPTIPLGPVMVNKELSGSMRELLENTLLNLNRENPAVLQSIKDGWSEAARSERFIKVDTALYDALLDLSVNRQVANFIIKAIQN